jgi:vacuolar protein sorting-associated protein 13A/C
LVTKIVDNLQITIQNIHIRFEDNISHPDGKPFSFGITLEQLSAVSTDEKWEEAFIAEAVDRIHKLLNLESFSMYWDSQSALSLKGLETEAFLGEFKKFILREENRTHVLKPITGCGKVIINKRRQPGEAKTLVNLFFDQFALFFDNDQYYDLLTLVNFFVSAERYQKVPPPSVLLEGCFIFILVW